MMPPNLFAFSSARKCRLILTEPRAAKKLQAGKETSKTCIGRAKCQEIADQSGHGLRIRQEIEEKEQRVSHGHFSDDRETVADVAPVLPRNILRKWGKQYQA